MPPFIFWVLVCLSPSQGPCLPSATIPGRASAWPSDPPRSLVSLRPSLNPSGLGSAVRVLCSMGAAPFWVCGHSAPWTGVTRISLVQSPTCSRGTRVLLTRISRYFPGSQGPWWPMVSPWSAPPVPAVFLGPGRPDTAQACARLMGDGADRLWTKRGLSPGDILMAARTPSGQAPPSLSACQHTLPREGASRGSQCPRSPDEPRAPQVTCGFR